MYRYCPTDEEYEELFVYAKRIIADLIRMEWVWGLQNLQYQLASFRYDDVKDAPSRIQERFRELFMEMDQAIERMG